MVTTKYSIRPQYMWGKAKIVPYVVERETETGCWVRLEPCHQKLTRFPKRSKDREIYDTWDDAHARLKILAAEYVAALEKRLQEAKEYARSVDELEPEAIELP